MNECGTLRVEIMRRATEQGAGLCAELEALRRDSGAGPEAGVRIYLIDRTNHLV